MKNRKSSALFLAAALVLSLCGTALATDTPLLTLASPATLPAVGETFKVTVSISGNPGLGAVQFTVTSDSAVVTCEDASIGKVLSGSLSATNPTASTGAIIAAASTETMSGDGTLGVLTYKVVAAGNPKFALSDIVLSDTNAKNIAFDLKTATISAGADTGAGTGGSGTGGSGTGDTSSPSESPTPTPSASPSPDPGSETAQLFSDVPASHWASGYIQKAVKAGLFNGMPDGSFRPDEAVTRAQFITVLWRSAGKPAATKNFHFSDIPDNSGLYYAGAVAWGAENGYINGVANGDGSFSFRPEGSITREQAMAILFRYSGSQSGTEALLTGVYDKQFADSGSISAYAKSALYWAVYNSYISGTSETTLSPQAQATRAQISKILVNYLENVKA